MAEGHKRFRRVEEPGDAHFLTWSCFRRQKFLRSDRSCIWLAKAISQAALKYRVRIWGYCFMPDHAHLLVAAVDDQPVMTGFSKSVKQSVAKRAVRWLQIHRPGDLDRLLDQQPNGVIAYRFWQRGPGFDRSLKNPADNHCRLDYLHDNPVKAGLCVRAEDWRWSSAAAWTTRLHADIKIDFESFPALNK